MTLGPGWRGLLPLVGLPELLMEVDRWCGFSRSLLHLTARRLPTPEHVRVVRPALFAVIVAEATNLGLATMATASGIPYGHLLRVRALCARSEETKRPRAARRFPFSSAGWFADATRRTYKRRTPTGH